MVKKTTKKTTRKGNKKQLSLKQELFCQYYVSEEFFGNGTQSYMKAFGTKENSARTLAGKLLANVDICNKINELLDEAGLNDNFVDKQLLMLIQQHEDKPTKLRAIAEYNKLKARVIKTLEEDDKEVEVTFKI